MSWDDTLIERAVLLKEPELITKHPKFKFTLLNTTFNCLMADIRDEEEKDDSGKFIGFAGCGDLDCHDCIFYTLGEPKRIEEALKWLKVGKYESAIDSQYYF